MVKAPRPVGREPVVVDLQALQSPTTRDRGIGTYSLSWAAAIERCDPSLVRAYVLNPRLAPPGRVDELLQSGKVRQRDELDLTGVELWQTMSPFDLHLATSDVAPALLFEHGIRHGVTVYDLIPALDPAQELADPIDRRRYRTRLEVIRHADVALTLSSKVGHDLVERAGIGGDRVHVVGAAPAPAFLPASNHSEARAIASKALSSEGLLGRYVLAVSGSHPRKNNEALIRAFCALPEEIAATLQLVITGEYDAPTINHYRHLAQEAGRAKSIVVAGFLSLEVLVALTQGADLAIVAALQEGFGLPIVEAQACCTPVIASDISPFDELVEVGGRFDPADEASITSALQRALSDTSLQERLRSPSVDTWQDVAARSVAALEATLARKPRHVPATQVLRRRRPRIAIVTPLPPAPSGIAGYSYSLVEALLRTEKVAVDVFYEEATSTPLAPLHAPAHPVAAFELVEGLLGAFDHVVYALGNSHHHLGALQLLRRRSGVVLAHDVRLSNLYRHLHGDPSMMPGGFEAALADMYEGEIPDGIGRDGEIAHSETERYGLLMAREAIAASSCYLVNSTFAASLARLDAGAASTTPIEVLPFAFSAARDEAPAFSEQQRAAPEALDGIQRRLWGASEPPEMTLIAHFGIVDPTKRPELLLDAHAALSATGHEALLCFVGPVGDELCARLTDHAARLGTSASVAFTGPLPPASYQRWLRHATVAVQLRAVSNGEASAAVGECLAAGIPTIVSDLGWASELSDQAVVKVATDIDVTGLAATLKRLLADAALRRELTIGARVEASAHTFDHTARALLEVLGRSRPASPRELTAGAASSPRLASFR